MDRPGETHEIRLVGILRTLKKTQDEVADILKMRKERVGRIENWIRDEKLELVEAVFDDERLRRVIDEELVEMDGVDPLDLVHAARGTHDDILEHYRVGYIPRSKPSAKGIPGGPTESDQLTSGLIQKHTNDLVEAVIPELEGINVFPARDLDLAIFWSRPNEPRWPISKGRMKRHDGGCIVQLAIEKKLEWAYLRQHLKDDPIWDAIDTWKQAMVMDLNARFGLLAKIATETQSRIGLSVLDNLTGSENDKDALGLYYAYTIYDQVFSQVVGIPLAQKRREEFTFEPPNVTNLGSYLIVRSHDISLHTLAINYLLDAQISLAELPEARAVRSAYNSALSKTALVKKHSERIRLAVAFPEGSKCDGCTQQV
ncbi:hypothetical protein ACFLVS_06400 [Chloroflexota bacterium]